MRKSGPPTFSFFIFHFSVSYSLICSCLSPMLQKLFIQNYAIIDEIEIDFSSRLNIITGETGAGKSILMGALSLILGGRADSSVLLNREKKCVAEGSFAAGNKKPVKRFLKDNDLDPEDILIIRREIGANGKSRAFVNDTPVSLTQLRALSSLLVDLHQQFDALEIGESDFQREVIDALAGQGDLLQQYQSVYQQWRQHKKTLDELQEQKTKFTSEYDYNKFLYDELEEAGLKENELEDMDNELKLLNNSESIKAALSRVNYELSEGEQPVVQQLKSLLHQLQPFGDYHPELPALLLRLQSAQIELGDIAGEVSHINDHVQYDPQRIEQINDRLSKGYRLLKKHSLQNTHELLALQEGLSNKLKAVLDMDDAIAAATKQTAQSFEQAGALAAKLSASRTKQVKPLEEKVNTLLAQVGMPNARLKVTVQPLPLLAAHGADAVEFLFDANKSNRFEPVHKVASGGELSRLMLCIKSLVAQSLDLPTLIFDEIDTGISGEAAKQVGIIMKDLAKKRQVIAITHQPQIAGKADAHFFVYKESKKDMVKTNIRLLSNEERITAIAKMLSGEKPTPAALENAREMVKG